MDNSNKTVNKFTAIFWIIVAADITGIIPGINLLHFIAKPLLMPVLIAWLISSKPISHRMLALTGLFFSWAGDVLLLFEKNGALFFTGGLVCFLLTHICYIIYFLKTRPIEPSLLKTQPWWIILVPAYGTALVWLLFPHLADMKLPVMIYAVVICSMLLCSLHAFKSTSFPSRYYFVTGALLFVASDSLLAINKFYQPFAFAGSLIMLTYCGAQYLIVTGIIKKK